jgi:hypothetical protein
LGGSRLRVGRAVRAGAKREMVTDGEGKVARQRPSAGAGAATPPPAIPPQRNKDSLPLHTRPRP